MTFITPEALKKELPLTTPLSSTRTAVQNILTGSDPRLLLIVGPCSIHNIDEAYQYAALLKELSLQVEEAALILMRVYIEKPRTRAGWKGFIHDPNLDDSHAIEEGLSLSRKLLLHLSDLQLPAATEFLSPQFAPYFEDLISWGCIGARTSSSPIHRHLASHLPLPIGFKNSCEGNIQCAIDGLLVASKPQNFLHIDERGRLEYITSSGNPHTHIVLRGSTRSPNYHKTALQEAQNQLRQFDLSPNLIVDCSHGNCQGDYRNQPAVFLDLLSQIEEGNSHIRGIMLESNLEEGQQEITPSLKPGISITDSCINFVQTKELIEELYSRLMIFTKS